jgi:hypothetical protein
MTFRIHPMKRRQNAGPMWFWGPSPPTYHAAPTAQYTNAGPLRRLPGPAPPPCASTGLPRRSRAPGRLVWPCGGCLGACQNCPGQSGRRRPGRPYCFYGPHRTAVALATRVARCRTSSPHEGEPPAVSPIRPNKGRLPLRVSLAPGAAASQLGVNLAAALPGSPWHVPFRGCG